MTTTIYTCDCCGATIDTSITYYVLPIKALVIDDDTGETTGETTLSSASSQMLCPNCAQTLANVISKIQNIYKVETVPNNDSNNLGYEVTNNDKTIILTPLPSDES